MNWSVLEITVPIIAAIVISVLIVFRKPVWGFVKTWQEIYSLPLGFIFFYFSGYLFWYLDPTAAVFDIGALQLFIFALIGVMIGSGSAWLAIKFGFNTVWKFMQNIFDDSYEHRLTTWERTKFFMWLFSLFFLGFILLVRVL